LGVGTPGVMRDENTVNELYDRACNEATEDEFSPRTPHFQSARNPIRVNSYSVSPTLPPASRTSFPTEGSMTEKVPVTREIFFSFCKRFSESTLFEFAKSVGVSDEFVDTMMTRLLKTHAEDQPINYISRHTKENAQLLLTQRAVAIDRIIYGFRHNYYWSIGHGNSNLLRCVHTLDRMLSIFATKTNGALPADEFVYKNAACITVLVHKWATGFDIHKADQVYQKLLGKRWPIETNFARDSEMTVLKDLGLRLNSISVEDFFEPLALLLHSLFVFASIDSTKWLDRILAFARCYADAASIEYECYTVPRFSQKMLAAACFCRACEFAFGPGQFVWGDVDSTSVPISPFASFAGFNRRELDPLIKIINKNVSEGKLFTEALRVFTRVSGYFYPKALGSD